MRRVACSFLVVSVIVPMLVAFGGASSAGSVTASARISAHLTKTSFAAADAATVKLIYKFSSKSVRFAYVLSRQQGAKWLKVRAISKRGSFRGSHTMTVKQLFGSSAVKVGRYRVKLSADANSATRSFTVIKPPSGNNPPSGAVVPVAGLWRSTGLSGPYNSFGVTVTRLFFVVAPDRATVASFSFDYDWNGTPYPAKSCSGSGGSAESAPSPITNGQFFTPGISGSWSGGGAGSFHGTFDSPTGAHGTAQFGTYVNGIGCMFSASPSTGTFSWTAAPAQ